MAIVGTTYGEHESKWGFAEEATFGTAIADNQEFEKMMGPMPTEDFGLMKMNDVKGGDGRFRNAANDFVSDAGGLRVISFSDLLLNLEDLGWLLYAVCQNVSEGASTPFEKTFTLSTATTQPNFAANAGMFLTVGIYDAIASSQRKYTSCILKNLILSSDLSGDGLLRASGEFISGFTFATNSNFSGTWNFNTQTYFNFNKPSAAKIATLDVVLFGFDISINNNGIRVGSDSSGNADTYFLGGGPGGYEVTGNIKCKYDSNTKDLIGADVASTSVAIQLATGTDGATGNFDYTCSSNILSGTNKDYGEARGQAINIPFVANTSAVFTCSDALDQGW